jgi:hypothetical protein
MRLPPESELRISRVDEACQTALVDGMADRRAVGPAAIEHEALHRPGFQRGPGRGDRCPERPPEQVEPVSADRLRHGPDGGDLELDRPRALAGFGKSAPGSVVAHEGAASRQGEVEGSDGAHRPVELEVTQPAGYDDQGWP